MDPRVVNPPTGGPYAATGHRAGIIGAEFHVGDLRAELLADASLGSFGPFRGFQGSAVPLPPDVARGLAERAAPRLEVLAQADLGARAGAGRAHGRDGLVSGRGAVPR